MKLRAWLERVRDSLWFIPSLLAIGAIVLATVMVQVDLLFATPERIRELWWLFGGSPEGARGVLTAIAGSLITVTGVVFSITIVALQLASSQFTPRLLQNFMSDRINQLVLGVFIGTFTYTLLILRTVRSPIGDETPVYLPATSVSMAVLLALVSMGFLIYYIDHIAGWIEASTIVDRVAGEAMKRVRRFMPLSDGDEEEELTLPEGEASYVLAHRSGYVQMLEHDRLLQLAIDADVVIEVQAPVGDFVLSSDPLARVWPAERADDGLRGNVRDLFVLGHRRTHSQDVELGLIQLADIAVKALSPGINDPTTAMLCLDRIGEVVATIGQRHRQFGRRDEDGTVRTMLPLLDFERVVEVAFSQIRRYGGGDPAVLVHLLDTLRRAGHRLAASERAVLSGRIDETLRQAEIGITHDVDLDHVRRAAARAREALAEAPARDQDEDA